MNLTSDVSRHNFRAFLWHAIFLALARNFMDVDTVIPAMVVESGGRAMHIGLLTMLMLGGANFTQLIFAPFLSNLPYKRSSLIWSINARVLSLLGLGGLLFFSSSLWMIILFLTIFSFSGAFAMISYTDILGKSITEQTRKSFFSIRQFITGAGAFASALLVHQMLHRWEYPLNYAFMLGVGGLALFIASLGFWQIREVEPSGMAIRGLRHFWQVMRTEIRENPRLSSYLGYINMQGVILALLPFVILYANAKLPEGTSLAGEFLVWKVAGMAGIALLIYLFSKRVSYRLVLYATALLAMLIPVMLLLFPYGWTFQFAFLLGGVVLTLFGIGGSGVLLELSGLHNRALYAGIAGAGNIVPAIFPIAGGWIIQQWGFEAFFILFMALIASSLYFVRKINCQQ